MPAASELFVGRIESMILSIRSDKPEAEIGLFDESGKQLAYETWTAHRQLAETIHKKILDLLKSQKAEWHDISGVVVFAGPGSFTGLRIGVSVANALGYGLQVPVAATKNDDWQTSGLRKLKDLQGFTPVEPDYGAPVFTTKPTK